MPRDLRSVDAPRGGEGGQSDSRAKPPPDAAGRQLRGGIGELRTAIAGQFASSAVVLVGGDGRRVGQGHIGSLSSPLAVAGGRAGEWGPWRAGMAHGWGRSRETRESGSVTPAHRECNAHGCGAPRAGRVLCI